MFRPLVCGFSGKHYPVPYINTNTVPLASLSAERCDFLATMFSFDGGINYCPLSGSPFIRLSAANDPTKLIYLAEKFGGSIRPYPRRSDNKVCYDYAMFRPEPTKSVFKLLSGRISKRQKVFSCALEWCPSMNIVAKAEFRGRLDRLKHESMYCPQVFLSMGHFAGFIEASSGLQYSDRRRGRLSLFSREVKTFSNLEVFLRDRGIVGSSESIGKVTNGTVGTYRYHVNSAVTERIVAAVLHTGLLLEKHNIMIGALDRRL